MEMSPYEQEFLKLYNDMLEGKITLHEFAQQIEYLPQLSNCFLEYWKNKKILDKLYTIR